MNYLTIIGDVHGKLQEYMAICQESKFTIQVGDLGFNYEPLKSMHPYCHQFIGGNHDNYDVYHKTPGACGDYGSPACFANFFFIRGAYSIDMNYRLEHERRTGVKSWWKEEQLSFPEMYTAYDQYQMYMPNVMLSHSAPTEIVKLISNPDILRQFGLREDHTTPTQCLLQSCFEFHQPRLWVFGHFHMNALVKLGKTTFICLNELSQLHIDRKGNWEFCEEKGNINED